MDYIHGAIVDNWSLELASHLLSNEYQDYIMTAQRQQELIKALFDFLDILVLNENIVYETGFSYVWDWNKSLALIKPYTIPITAIEKDNNQFIISEGIEESLNKKRFDGFYPQDKVVEDGAIFYLKIAEALGIQYWPAPKRQKFIDGLNSSSERNFLLFLDSDIKNKISRITSDVFQQFSAIKPTMLPGFGAKILADCDSPESIIPTAMQLRKDPYSIAFREWCREMDCHLETGNVVALHKSAKEISLLLDDICKRFSTKKEDKNKTGVKFQVGLRPSISIEGNLIGSLIEKFLPKKLHIVFLRRHIESVLSNTNISHHVERLFNLKVDKI